MTALINLGFGVDMAVAALTADQLDDAVGYMINRPCALTDARLAPCAAGGERAWLAVVCAEHTALFGHTLTLP